MVAMAVYSFTFGRYAAAAFGFDTFGARVLSVGIVVAFLLVNLRGVRISSLTEDAIVLTKLVILTGVAAIGISSWSARCASGKDVALAWSDSVLCPIPTHSSYSLES